MAERNKKMKRKIVVLGLVGIMSLCLGACGNNKEEITSTENVESETNITYIIEDCEYSVSESWEEKLSEESSRYYYPEEGMMMVMCDQSVMGSILDDSLRGEYLVGVESSVDNYKLLSETKIYIGNTSGYRFEISGLIDDADMEYSMVVFDSDSGLMIFMMISLANDSKQYDSEFQDVLDSVKVTESAKVDESDDESEIEDDGIISLEMEDYSISYSHHEVGADYEGNLCLYYYYIFTNISPENQTPAYAFSVKAFQNSIECSRAITMDDIPEIENYIKEIQPGGSLVVCEVYELEDTSEVTIEAEELISFTSEIDSQKIIIE